MGKRQYQGILSIGMDVNHVMVLALNMLKKAEAEVWLSLLSEKE
jgi:hypothetical protein